MQFFHYTALILACMTAIASAAPVPEVNVEARDSAEIAAREPTPICMRFKCY